MDWGSIVRVSEYLGAILVIGGVIVSVFVNLRKIVHVYDKMEELINNTINNSFAEYSKTINSNEPHNVVKTFIPFNGADTNNITDVK